MKKTMLELKIMVLGFCMAAVFGLISQGFSLAMTGIALEFVFGTMLYRQLVLLDREMRRIARRARQDARAHHAAQMYRAGVRLGTVNTAVAAEGTVRPVPDLQVA